MITWNTYFMVSLCDHLPDGLHDALKFLHGPHHAALDQFELRLDSHSQLLQRGIVRFDIPDHVCSLRKFAKKVILGGNRMEEDGKMEGKYVLRVVVGGKRVLSELVK
jgi:hypothetical protein